MTEQGLRFRVGLFVLIMLLLLAGLVVTFGGMPSFFRTYESYTVMFPKSGGANTGTPVRRSGVRIGEVGSIELDDATSKVKVIVMLDPRYKLRRSDRPTIVQGLLGGDAAIDLIPAPPEEQKGNGTPVPVGSTVDGYVQADPGTLLDRTSKLLNPTADALNEFKALFARFEKFAPTFDRLLKDFEDITKMARAGGPELSRTNDEVRDLAKSARAALPDLQKTGAEIQATARTWGKVGDRVNGLLGDNEQKTLKTMDRFDELLKRLNEALSEDNQKNLNRILVNVAKSSERFESVALNAEEMVKEGRLSFENINRVLNEQNQKNLAATLDNMKKSSDRFPGITNSVEHLIYEARVTARRLDAFMTRTESFLGKMETTAESVTGKVPSLLDQVECMTVNVNKLTLDARELLNAITRTDGTVQRLISDPSLYTNLNASAAMVTQMLPRLDRVLRDVEVFADKIARHPESLGLGGVVRPATGLKGPPTALPYHGPNP